VIYLDFWFTIQDCSRPPVPAIKIPSSQNFPRGDEESQDFLIFHYEDFLKSGGFHAILFFQQRKTHDELCGSWRSNQINARNYIDQNTTLCMLTPNCRTRQTSERVNTIVTDCTCHFTDDIQ
jgi:hypothetical protein